jgi:hypothetical protein
MLLLQYVVAVCDDAIEIRLLFRSNAKGDNDIPPIASGGLPLRAAAPKAAVSANYEFLCRAENSWRDFAANPSLY